MRDISARVKNVILNTFDNKRIISLLYFGTSAFNNRTNDNSDYDFLLVLNKYKADDLTNLRRNIIKNKLNRLNLDINFLYKTDLDTRGKDNFQLRSLQPTFYKYLEHAITLYGKNIFKDSPINLTNKQVNKMLDFKIQEHYGRCDKLYLKGVPEEAIHNAMTKYCRDTTRYFLIKKGFMKLEDITKFSFDNIIEIVKKEKIFSPSLRKRISVLKIMYSRPRDIIIADQIRRQMYQHFLENFDSSK